MQPPFFSVIVPTHGRDAALRHCLEALRCQDYPKDRYEVIVVLDGCSSSPTNENEFPAVQYLTQPKSGPAAARNLGASHAKGHYLAFTDDDCIPTTNWLTQLSAAFQQYPDRMIGGQVANILPNNPYAAASQLLVDFLYQQYNQDPHQPQFFTSNNLALPSHLFLEIGGFDTRFPLAAGEDRELCHRWIENGHGMYYQQSALVHHAHRLTLPGYWQQHLNYGRGAYHFHQKKAGSDNGRSKLQPPSFYITLLLYPLHQTKSPLAFRLFILFLIMQAANTLGYLLERWSTKNPR